MPRRPISIGTRGSCSRRGVSTLYPARRLGWTNDVYAASLRANPALGPTYVMSDEMLATLSEFLEPYRGDGAPARQGTEAPAVA